MVVHGGEAARYTAAYRNQLQEVANTYANMDEYGALWQPQIDQETRGTDYPSYDAVRSVTQEEFEEVLSPIAPQLTTLSKEHHIPIKDLVRALAHTPDPCGDSSGSQELTEEYCKRSLWPLLLAVTNISDEPVQLHDLVGNGQGAEGFSPLRDALGKLKSTQMPVPRAPLEPQATAVIQIGNLLGSFSGIERVDHFQEQVDVDGVGFRVLSLTSLRLDDALGYAGPLTLPHTIVVANSIGVQQIPVHVFDPALVYAVDTQWMMGCCPHLYARVADQWDYLTSLFTSAPGCTTQECITLPLGTTEVIIAELEHEISWLTSVTANGICLVKDITLRRGDSIRLFIDGDAELTVKGGYLPPPKGIKSRLYRNAIIRGELGRLRQVL